MNRKNTSTLLHTMLAQTNNSQKLKQHSREELTQLMNLLKEYEEKVRKQTALQTEILFI